jgi:hypothetical protein
MRQYYNRQEETRRGVRRVLVLLVLGDEILHVGLGLRELSEFQLVIRQ